MISVDKSFLFIHVPKTGGNSIQNILQNYSEDDIVLLNDYQDGIERFELRNKNYKIHKHSTLQDYKNVLEPKVFNRLFKFATIRNPWDLMISYYFSPHRGKVEWNRNDFIKLLNSTKTFQDYVELKESRNPFSRGFRNIFYPKENLTNFGLDFILKFESIDLDFEKLCSLIDIPYQKLPVRNKSKRKHYSFYYDEDLVNMVSEKFSIEIEFGDYKFELHG